MRDIVAFMNARLDEEENGVHLTRDRALREIQAKRKILAEYERLDTYRDFRHPPLQASLLAMQSAVQWLASVYSDHSDYDPAYPPLSQEES